MLASAALCGAIALALATTTYAAPIRDGARPRRAGRASAVHPGSVSAGAIGARKYRAHGPAGPNAERRRARRHDERRGASDGSRAEHFDGPGGADGARSESRPEEQPPRRQHRRAGHHRRARRFSADDERELSAQLRVATRAGYRRRHDDDRLEHGGDRERQDRVRCCRGTAVLFGGLGRQPQHDRRRRVFDVQPAARLYVAGQFDAAALAEFHDRRGAQRPGRHVRGSRRSPTSRCSSRSCRRKRRRRTPISASWTRSKGARSRSRTWIWRQESLHDSQERVAVGQAPPIDIITAQALVESNREQLIIADASIATAEDQLRSQILDPSRPDYWDVNIQPTDAIQLTPRPWTARRR